MHIPRAATDLFGIDNSERSVESSFRLNHKITFKTRTVILGRDIDQYDFESSISDHCIDARFRNNDTDDF